MNRKAVKHLEYKAQYMRKRCTG